MDNITSITINLNFKFFVPEFIYLSLFMSASRHQNVLLNAKIKIVCLFCLLISVYFQIDYRDMS